MKEELQKKIDEATEALKDNNRFIDLFSDKPKGTLTRLYETIRQIGLLLKLNEIKDVAGPDGKVVIGGMHKSGILVKIRPCGKEYKDKTYLGLYIGDIATGSSISIKEDKIQLEYAGHNPGIFVPELGKIIYGYESWWGEIEEEKDLKDITDNDIQNVWYVKLLKAMGEKKNEAHT